MKYLIDTSILIDHLRRGSSWNNFLGSERLSDSEYFISSITIFELHSGQSTRRKKMKEEVRQLIKNFTIIEVTEKIAEIGGELCRDSKEKIGFPDYIIGASAIEIGATVVTLNQKHFKKIPGVRVFDFN